MNETRSRIHKAVSQVTPFDDLETEHINDVLAWVASNEPIFRVAKPDNPPKHLVSYFVLYDEPRDLLMLIDHVKAKAWLPTGGHIDPNEDSRTTVVREAKEELAIKAMFDTRFASVDCFIITKHFC